VRLAALIAGLSFHLPAAPAAIEKQFHVRIRMRDGVHLCANVYKPAGTLKLPTLLVRTPYNKGADLTPNYRVLGVRHRSDGSLGFLFCGTNLSV
jgi:predicted acyl esterase